MVAQAIMASIARSTSNSVIDITQYETPPRNEQVKVDSMQNHLCQRNKINNLAAAARTRDTSAIA